MRRHDELTTERLLLRRWRDDDRGPFARMNADPRVRRYYPGLQDRASSDADVARFEERFARNGFGLWAVQRLAERDFIGYTGLNPMPDGLPSVGGCEIDWAGEWEIGWRLASAAWHSGYATEAARAVLELAFGDLCVDDPRSGGLGLDAVWSLTTVTNEPSIAVMRRIGMSEHARVEHPGLPAGHPLRPHVVYRITR